MRSSSARHLLAGEQLAAACLPLTNGSWPLAAAAACSWCVAPSLLITAKATRPAHTSSLFTISALSFLPGKKSKCLVEINWYFFRAPHVINFYRCHGISVYCIGVPAIFNNAIFLFFFLLRIISEQIMFFMGLKADLPREVPEME